jgi:hypothetical protein
MGLVIAFKNQVLTAEQASGGLTAYSQQMAMGGFNRLGLETMVQSLFVTGGTVTLTLTVEGSNDGLEWTATALADTATAAGPSFATNDIDRGLVRVKAALTVTGGVGTDWGSMLFDCNLNFLMR